MVSNMHYQTTGTQTVNVFFKELCETTSFHGVSYLYHSPNRYWRLTWLIIICLGIGGFTYEIYKIFNDYKTAPYSSSYSFDAPFDGIPFPNIILCNTNFINSSKVKTLNYSKAVVNAAKLMVLNPMEDVIGSVFDPTYHYLNKILAEADPAASTNFLPNVLEDLQFDQDEFIKACFFDQQECDKFNVSIKEMPDFEHGVCFVVNVNGKQTKSGEGLQLILDTHSELWWVDQPTFGQGVVVRIEKTYNPAILRSYFVLPGHVTKIGISAIHYKMLAKNNCRDEMSREIFNFNVSYTEDSCRMECFFRVALKYCGCVRSIPPEYLIEANLPQCRNSSQQVCLKKASMFEKHDSASTSCKRQCLPPCDSWDYRPSISMLKFPAQPVTQVLSEMYNKTIEDSRFDDFVILDIAFEQLQVRVINRLRFHKFACNNNF